MRNLITLGLLLCITFFGNSQEWQECEWQDFVRAINRTNMRLEKMKSEGMGMKNILLFYKDYEITSPMDSTVLLYHFKGQNVCLFTKGETQVTDGKISVMIDLEDSIVTITNPVELDRFNVNTLVDEMKLETAPKLKCTKKDSVEIFFLPAGIESGYMGFEYWICKDVIVKYVAYSTREIFVGKLGQKELVKPRMELIVNYETINSNSAIKKIEIGEVILQKEGQILLTEDYKNFEIIDIR